ncbi:hypothetical protein [Streptomyces sp. NPDC127084]|uniref:hypothetical protein n=1 Tax=Streptomyces sp. NPDC127084 TaxID=3347133 RepID=UPI003654EABA
MDANEETCVMLGGTLFDVVMTGGEDVGPAMVAAVDAALPPGCGPVIADPSGPWLYWLVKPGTARVWAGHQYGLCLSAPMAVRLPPLTHFVPTAEGGCYWLHSPVGLRLTDPVALRSALNAYKPGPCPYEALAEVMFGRDALVKVAALPALEDEDDI